MYYEINVSKNGKHYFATHSRSVTNEMQARQMLMHFRLVFPECDGYKCDAMLWQHSELMDSLCSKQMNW